MLNRWMIRIAVFGALFAVGTFAADPPPKAARAPVERPAKPAPAQGTDQATKPPPAQSTNQGNPRPAPVATPNNPEPRPRNAEEAHQRALRDQADADRRNRDRDRDRRDRTIIIVPRSIYGWSPYAWWWSDNSYWMPPVEDYNTPEPDARADDSQPTPVPATPSDIPATPRIEASPEYQKMAADLNREQAAYDAASARVLEKLKSNPDYQALIKQRDQAKEEVEAVQAAARIPNPDQTTPAAQRKLDLSAKITRMEQDAIAADPQASAAKARIIDLNARLTAARNQPR